MSSVIEHYRMMMTEDDKVFFQELGQRIAKQRKELDMTQGKLAEYLGISQQHMASFEKGIRKIPASMFPVLSQLFGITIDELMGIKFAAKRGPTPKLQQQIEQVGLMPRSKQRFITEMLEALIKQQQAS